MDSAINAASSSRSITAFWKGKQRAEPRCDETSTVENSVVDTDWNLVRTLYSQSYPLLPECPSSSTSLALVHDEFGDAPDLVPAVFKENTTGMAFFGMCEQVLRITDERCAKIADREAGLEKLKKVCQAEQATITALEDKAPIDFVAHMGVETRNQAHSAFLQERIQEALGILNTLCETIDTLLQVPKEPISKLDLSLKHMAEEVIALQKSLPAPARAFLGVVLFAAILVPLAILVWYSLTSLGLISAAAALPKAIAGGAWGVSVIIGVLKSWPEYKNACAENASSHTRQLIQCYETIRIAHKDLKRKMDSAKINQAADQASNAARASAFFGSHNFARVNEVKQDTTAIKSQLERLLATERTPSPEFLALEKAYAEEKAARAELEKQLEEAKLQKEQYKTVILMNGIDISKLG